MATTTWSVTAATSATTATTTTAAAGHVRSKWTGATTVSVVEYTTGGGHERRGEAGLLLVASVRRCHLRGQDGGSRGAGTVSYGETVGQSQVAKVILIVLVCLKLIASGTLVFSLHNVYVCAVLLAKRGEVH